jgi:hypothetical protein
VAEEFATATVARATLQHFSIYYDSLIEKCCTVSGSERREVPHRPFSH